MTLATTCSASGMSIASDRILQNIEANTSKKR
jgi:hypothetical protein